MDRMNEKAKKEREALVDKIHDDISSRIDEINFYFGLHLVTLLDRGVVIYTLDHSEDPYWDHSGKLVETGAVVSKASTMSLEDFFELSSSMYPSYESGCGMYVSDIFEDEFNSGYWELLDGFQEKIIAQILEDPAYSDYISYVKADMHGLDSIEEAIADELNGDATLLYEFEYLEESDFSPESKTPVCELYKRYKSNILEFPGR